jgi:YbbR domain-containing protein
MMLRSLLRRLWGNIGTLALAFMLAFAVWISAVVAADPNEVRDFPQALPLTVRGLDSELMLIGNLPDAVTARIGAPVSLWQQLSSNADALTAYIDLSDLAQGEHVVEIQIESSLRPIRVLQVNPAEVTIALQPRAIRQLDIAPKVEGQPALGFQIDTFEITPDSATVIGPVDLVNQVSELQAVLDVTDARESLTTQVPVEAIDSQGNVLSGLVIEPAEVTLNLNILQAGGYREVAVKVETIGQPASGFRVTDISVSPPVVTLFSTDPQIVAGLPGFVSTQPLDLSSTNDDLQTRLSLALPAGVIVVGDEQNVIVTIGIAPIETSVLLNLQVEVIGLPAGMEAELSPQTVGVILSGPLSVLQSITGDQVRLFVDVTGLQEGTHLLEPQVEILPSDVAALSITPSAIEVVLQRSSQP